VVRWFLDAYDNEDSPRSDYYFLAHLQCSLKFACKLIPWYLHYVDKLTSKKYAKAVNLICAGIVDLTFRITTCRFLLAIVSCSWDLVCINLSFAPRDFVCARMTSIRIASFGFVHRRGHHAFRESSCVLLAHGPRWLFLLSPHCKAFLLLLIRSLL